MAVVTFGEGALFVDGTRVGALDVDETLKRMWDRCALTPTHMIVSPHAERLVMRIKYPSMPIARTSKMRRLRKLKYRRHP
jgi:hypothetical protein